jgi:hypothetical protein
MILFINNSTCFNSVRDSIREENGKTPSVNEPISSKIAYDFNNDIKDDNLDPGLFWTAVLKDA